MMGDVRSKVEIDCDVFIFMDGRGTEGERNGNFIYLIFNLWSAYN